MGWSIFLGWKVRSDVVVITPLTIPKAITYKTGNLCQHCIMPCIIASFSEGNGTCVENVTQGLELSTQLAVCGNIPLPAHKVGIVRKCIFGGIESETQNGRW